MKALIKNVEFNKEFETKFGTLYSFKVWYNDKWAYYSSKKKDQTNFVKGKETEFEEQLQKTEKGEFWKITLPKKSFGGYNKAIKKEQSRYSGFAVSYVKDLIIADKINIKDLEKASEKVFNLMVKLDKTLEK
jgi:hypothetical protein